MIYNEEFVRIRNPIQLKKYIKHGVKPIDVYYDKYDDKIVYIFTVRETQELYNLWCNRELD